MDEHAGGLIDLRAVVKTYRTAAGDYTALKGVDLRVGAGEFVAVIGKSGSGKSTLINMITGIDRPTSGEVWVAGTPVHTLSEGRMAKWRGKNLGVVFQFFQLLPMLTLLENIILPMEFCKLYSGRERRERALHLLDRVGLADRAHKRPAEVSGGQQQRVAIARALANDPPVIVADEPTGNLDSQMAESIFGLFEELVRSGKTIIMVTHDNDLARRATRTVVVADGEVVNQFVTTALATLDLDQLSAVASKLQPERYEPGTVIIRQGDEADRFYIITEGSTEVSIRHPGGQEIVVAQLTQGQYFGEVALLLGGRRTATVSAGGHGTEVMSLGRDVFQRIAADSQLTREELDRVIRERIGELTQIAQAAAN